MNMFLGKIMELVSIAILAAFFVRAVQEIMKQGWWARNFDFKALFYISFPAVILFFGMLPSDKDAPSFIEKQAFLFSVLLGFPVLIKRLSVMQEQVEKSQQQVDIGQKQMRFNQYSEGKKLLWSEQLSSRMEGVEALWQFVKTYPEEYQRVMETFSQFIKYPLPYELDEKRQNDLKSVRPQYAKRETPAGERRDINAILQHMCREIVAGTTAYEIDFINAHLEGANFFRAHLKRANLISAHLDGADFFGARLDGAYLSNAHLDRADFFGARLDGADLSNTHLERAIFFGARLDGAYLNNAHLEGANLMLTIINDVNFTNAYNLREEQIDECVFITDDAFSEKHPILPKGLKRTYKELSWEEWEEEKSKLLRF